MQKKPMIEQPFIFTIFGASGDLAKLKIFPALFVMAVQKRMQKDYYIIGYARSKKPTSSLEKNLKRRLEMN